MNLKIILIASLLLVSLKATCQPEKEINKTDQEGRKQGHWIKIFPNGSILYDGYFKDDAPFGEFRRYYEDKKLKSLVIFSSNGAEADAKIYHPNGYIASKGKYTNQLKEGNWQFFSSLYEGYLISEELYSGNLRNGSSVKFYPDSTIAERLFYKNGVRHGEWSKYYPSGKISLKSNYLNGKLNGNFETWFENGQIEFSGQYKNDSRDGTWIIYNNNNTIKYKLKYLEGVTLDRQIDIDASDYLDSLENNKGKIADPEKTGVIW